MCDSHSSKQPRNVSSELIHGENLLHLLISIKSDGFRESYIVHRFKLVWGKQTFKSRLT